MITAIDTPPIVAPGPTWRIRTTGVATVLGWLLVAGAIAFSYFGHAPSPYGTCYASSGRMVPCAALARR